MVHFGTEQLILGQFGEFSGLVLQTSIISVFGFLVSGVFIYLYYNKFYGVTEAPRGWKTFFAGLILMGLYQIMKIPYTYRILEGDVSLIIFLIFQLIAVSVMTYGLYLLKKEVEFG